MAQEKILGNQLNLTDVAAELAPYSPTNIVDDTSPQLGGNLDTNNFNIVTSDSIDSGSPTTSQYSNPTVIRTGNVSTSGYTYSTAGNIEIIAGSGLAGELSYGGALTLRGGNSVRAEDTTAFQYPGSIHLYGGQTEYANGGEYAGCFRFVAGTGHVGNYGGYCKMYAGQAVGSGGNGAGGQMRIKAGNGNNCEGGALLMYSGQSSGNYGSGRMTIQAGGTSGNIKPDLMSIRAGGASGTDGGDMELSAGGGGAAYTGGNIILQPGARQGVSDGTFAGAVRIEAPKSNTGVGIVQLWNSTNTAHTTGNFVALKAPTFTGSPVVDRTWTLPDDDPTTAAGQFLTTDASGVLSFAAAGGGSGITVSNPVGTGSPISTTLALSDADTFMVVDEDTPNSIIIPDDIDVAFPIGTRIEVLQRGGGITSIAVDAAGSPPVFMFVSGNGFTAAPIDLAEGLVATLTKIAASLWSVAVSATVSGGGG